MLLQLLTGPGGGAIISEYEELLDALLKRTVDAEVGWDWLGLLGWRCVLCLPGMVVWECTAAGSAAANLGSLHLPIMPAG